MKPITIGLLTAALFASGLVMAGESETVKMKIEGMTCGMCEAKVKKQLASLCETVTVNHETGEGTCLPKEGTTSDQVIKEANKTGFKTSKRN